MNAEPAANPFAQDVAEPLPGPTTVVIFGATGDLAARKLLPAIYNLGLGGLLPERFEVIGIGRRAGDSEAFRRHAHEAISTYSRTGIEDDAWRELEPRLDFLNGDFDDPKLFEALRSRIDEKDRGEPAQRVFYLAVSSSFFGPIAKALAAVGLGAGAEPPTRLMIEKPFGNDLASALKLAAHIS